MSVLQAVASFLLRYLVIALMFAIGTAARPRDIALIWRQPRLFVRPLLVMELGVPLLAMAAVAALPLAPVTAGLVLLMAVCPGAPFVPFAIRRKGESHSPYALDLLIIVTLLAPLTVPLWVAVISRLFPADLRVNPLAILGTILRLVIVPLAAGVTLSYLLPRVAAVLGAAAREFTFVALAVAIAFALYLGAPVLLTLRPPGAVVLIVVVLGSAWMGYRAGPRNDPEGDRATAVAAALGNPALVFAILAASRPNFKATAFVAAFLIARKIVLIPFERWMKHRATGERRPPLTAVPA
jgi:BASS family bile acid:Na+ symporter